MSVKKIGLTGGIGSGKTFIADIFRMMDVPVYNSDTKAKVLMTEDKVVKGKLIDLLGKKSYNKEGLLDRAYISKKIFSNKNLLEQMNAIVHPAVREDYKKFAKSHKKAKYTINEAALFVDNKSYKDFDALITVLSPLPLRLERTMNRDQSDQEEVMARIKNQSSDEEKIKVSDFLVYNDSTLNLFTQISVIHKALVK